MKKRLLSLLIVGVLMLGLMPNAYAALTYWYKGFDTREDGTADLNKTEFDAYEKNDAAECSRIMTYVDPDGTDANGNPKYKNTGMKVTFRDGDGKHSILNNWGTITHYAEYLNVDFGEHIPAKVEIYASTWAEGRKVIVKDGENLLAEVSIPKTSGYYNFSTPHTAQITIPTGVDMKGKHNIRIYTNGGNINVDAFRFEWQYEDTQGPIEFTGDASNVGAKVSVDRAIDKADTNARLLLAEYNDNGSMIGVKKSNEQLIKEAEKAEFLVSGLKTSGATKFGAFLWYADNTIVKNSRFSPEDAEGNPNWVEDGTASSSEISAIANSGIVTISGSEVANERVIIAIVPKNYDITTPLYETTLYQIYETTVKEGKYFYKFKMPSTVPTGEYKVVVMGETFKKSVDNFLYTNPDDIYTVLKILADKSVEEVFSDDALLGKPDVVETEIGMYDGLTDADKTYINNKIKDFFSKEENKLPSEAKEDGKYEAWTVPLRDIILPELLVSYIKNNPENISQSIDYVKKYADVLGISENERYTKYYKEHENDVLHILIKNMKTKGASASTFVDLFDEAVAVLHFNALESWGYADESFTNFKTVLKKAGQNPVTDYAILTYEKLINKAKQELMNMFVNKNFETTDVIADLFMKNIGTYDKDEYKTKSKYELEPSKVKDSDEFTMEVWHENKAEEEETTEQKAFEDLNLVPWAKASINEMRARGVVNGKSDTIFAPNDSITREEFAAIVVRAFGLGTGDIDGITFSDVNKGAWYAAYIAKAAERGIVNGMDNNNFGVGQNVTREQIAAMLQRAVSATNKNIIPKKSRIGFADFMYISDYAYDAVSTLAKAEIINGTGNDNFSPKKSATRAEAVVMLHRLLTNIK